MIHALVDTVEHRQIIRFEAGNRAEFDAKHAGDPLWFFLDSYRVKYGANFQNFLTYPRKYRINDYGDIYLTDDDPIIDDTDNEIPEAPFGYTVLIGRDGRYLRGADGEFLYGLDENYEPPPSGHVWLVDSDLKILKDPDETYLTELEE